jgi:ribonuclease HI
MSYRLITDGACKGNPGPVGWSDLLGRDDRLSHGFQGAGSEVNTANTRMDLMAIFEEVKSIPAGNEVKIVTYSTSVITVAARRKSKLKHRDLVLALGAELAKVRSTFPHVYGHSRAPEHDIVDRLASAAAPGRMGCRRVKPCTGRQPPLAATEVN